MPDYDCILTSGSGFLDPGETLTMYTTGQIGNWNDACWSNPQYDKLAQRAGRRARPGQTVA